MKPSPKHYWTYQEVLLGLAASAFIFFLHGAIPFFTLPTLGQAVWSMGFSQSFAKGPLLNFYAHDFGIPSPAAMAFGLAGAWPASIFIRLGLHAADAYTVTAVIWLGLAMFSAYRIAFQISASRYIAIVLATLWMSMPIIWMHASYSMLSWGIALLSFYFFSAFKLFFTFSTEKRPNLLSIILYFAAANISIFMDGYTFVMFAIGASMVFIGSFLTRPEIRRPLLSISLPVHVLSFGIAYLLFSAYIGKSSFEGHSLDFFRGWGVDLSFILIPTRGVLWIPDLTGLSINRTNELYFGDSSVWTTTFSLPIIVFALISCWRIRESVRISASILAITVFSFYMALGPSLKINSVKPVQGSSHGHQSAMMSADLAIAPTGNAWISEKLPGFNVMRASYRWFALTLFGLWLLIAISFLHTNSRRRIILLPGALILILLNLPNFSNFWSKKIDARAMFMQIDGELVASLKDHIRESEIVAFIPWRNDFLANYIAPRAGFRTYNIGGDKNLVEAQSNWPPEMLAQGSEINSAKALNALKLLIDGVADVIVIPYFHMLWSPHLWVCPDHTIVKLSAKGREAFRALPGFICPEERKTLMQPVIKALQKVPYIEVAGTNLYATIRLRDEFLDGTKRAALYRDVLQGIQYPIILNEQFKSNSYVLRAGWHQMEANHVWSQSNAKLALPIPKECEAEKCYARVHFGVFGASAKRAVSVLFESTEAEWGWSGELLVDSHELNNVLIPLSGAAGVRRVTISIPEAISPQKLTGSPDARELGISLHRIDLVRP